MPRKLIEFHDEDLRTLHELAEDKSTTLQELMDEAVRDVLVKHRRFTDLRTALRESGAEKSAESVKATKSDKAAKRVKAAKPVKARPARSKR